MVPQKHQKGINNPASGLNRTLPPLDEEAMTVSYIIDEGDKSLLSSVQLWMSRLQLVTAVVSPQSPTDRVFTGVDPPCLQSAFFASTDGLLLGRVGTYVPEDTSVGNILTHATLSGALALHISAGAHPYISPFPTKNLRGRVTAIISYLSSFALVKYNRISVPISEGGSTAPQTRNPQPGREATTTTSGGSVKVSHPDPPIGLQSLRHRPITGSSEPVVTIERVYLRNLFRTRPPTSLFYEASSVTEPVSTPELQDAYSMLLRCNSVCVLLTFVGLLLAIIGIMAYVWTTFTLTAGIFVSVCFIVSLVGACYALH